MEIGFISDSELQDRINNAIEFIFTQYEESKTNNNNRYREETYRIIILYVVSVIEALLFQYIMNELSALQNLSTKTKYTYQIITFTK